MKIGMGMWMTSCQEAMGWGFGDLKKTVSLDSTLEEGSRFLILARPDQGPTGYPSVGWVSELRADDVWTVSIVRNCVSFSSCRKTLNSKRWIKVSYPNQKRVVTVFRVFRIPIRVWTLWTFYACEYLGRIFGPICYTFKGA